jgi:hypothetical protein
MTTQKLPGTDAARHGTGDADLTIMLAAHDAFRRDLTRLARAAGTANDPARRRPVAAGWELFKRELHLHHTAEDEIIWPALRDRLEHSQAALSVLDEMEAEHERIDPLLAAVDAEFARQPADSGLQPSNSGRLTGSGLQPGDSELQPGDSGPHPGDSGLQPGDSGRLADVIDALASTVTGHLRHEERDGLPLIGTALTAAEWRAVGRKIARKNGLTAGPEMFAWMLDGADREHSAATLAQLPPPLRLLYRAVWKPRFDKTARW